MYAATSSTASHSRPSSAERSEERSPRSFSTSGKSSGPVWPRLKSVGSWPASSSASTSARPRNRVPPRTRTLIPGNARSARKIASAPNRTASAGTRSSAACASVVEREVLGHAQRHEAVRLDAERREVAGVRHRRQQHRDGDALGVELPHHLGQRIEERHVGVGRALVVAEHLELDVGADDVPQLARAGRRGRSRVAACRRFRPRSRTGMTLRAVPPRTIVALTVFLSVAFELPALLAASAAAPRRGCAGRAALAARPPSLGAGRRPSPRPSPVRPA